MNYYNEIDPSAAAWLAALGAGNAIVPQVAAQFIEAFLEVEKDHVAPFGQSQKRA